jgi:methyl-accepting chemotaxis protein
MRHCSASAIVLRRRRPSRCSRGYFWRGAWSGPIQALRAGAERIGGGDFAQRISIRTGDELEGLADQFNDMGARLQESYADLENKVEQRTAELSESLEQQTATSEVLQVISSTPGRSAAGVQVDAQQRTANLRSEVWQSAAVSIGRGFAAADA